MMITLMCQCSNDHEWLAVIPKYYSSLKDWRCPHCSAPAQAAKFGGVHSTEEVTVRQSREERDSRTNRRRRT